jgi:hypothetical protein
VSPRPNPDVRNEHEESRQQPDRDRLVEACDGERDRVIHGQHDHHHDLAAQEFGEHAVDVAAIARVLGASRAAPA